MVFCSISGTTPEEPVISLKTGHLFERKLIEKYIDNTGKCPVSGESLTKGDLQEVKTASTVKPRPVQATSIPGMLAIFQDEWDALMLESYSLKQHLETVRQQLSHSLYQHDAACRVIARLVKERDAARSSLANAQASVPAASSGMDVEEQGVTKAVIKKMTDCAAALSKTRKKRSPPAGHATQEQVAAYKEASSHPIHGASKPGILCVSVDWKDGGATVATGGADGDVQVFSKASGKVAATLSGHKKKVNQVVVHPTQNLVISASADKTARVWASASGDFATACQVTCHTGEVTGVALHPTGDFFVASSLDQSWSFHDIATGSCMVQKEDASVKGGFSATKFHPDGLILATGTSDARVMIWDIKAQKSAAQFEGHEQGVKSISFSENGYYMASGDGKAVKIWDLRKLKTLQTLEVACSGVDFDYSGQFLAAGAGNAVNVYHTKTWDVVAEYKGHKGAVTSVAWAPNASYLASTSMDRSLKFFGA